MYLYTSEDEGGAAGDTGSATHVAVREYHRGRSLTQSLATMGEERTKYPQADLQDAAAMFLHYATDPRNATAEVLLTEEKISFQIAAAAEDPTGEPIAINGTLDQVRRVDGVLRVYDLKTSRKEPYSILSQTTFQMAAYVVGACYKLGENVQPGALIMPRKYRPGSIPSSPVFWHYSWMLKDIEHILDGVRHVVASIRRGHLWHVPNENCIWCPQKSPDLCLPRLQETLEVLNHVRTEKP